MTHHVPNPLNAMSKAIQDHYVIDENICMSTLIKEAQLSDQENAAIHQLALDIATNIRNKSSKADTVDRVMHTFDLTTQEGILLMCLAEAYLRIPDNKTKMDLLQDKLSQANFEKFLAKDSSNKLILLLQKAKQILVNSPDNSSLLSMMKKLTTTVGAPMIRTVSAKAMQLFATKFVMGQTIEDALKKSDQDQAKGFSHSFDMLGEEAYTQEDADQYYQAYDQALDAIAEHTKDSPSLLGPAISIKLSALHPRYEYKQKERVHDELYDRIKALCQKAVRGNIALTIDAEEAHRLEISLEIIERLSHDPDLKGWNGLGLAVQAYQKRASKVLKWLVELGQQTNRRFQVRLVKGAYWDTEIKAAQILGLSSYPVFTRKESTDISYIACAKIMLAHHDVIYPQFATHNARTIATIVTLAGEYKDFEFQCLYGMGHAIFTDLLQRQDFPYLCRLYAPVGAFEDLLPYLVRRILENGANNSFVNQIADQDTPIAASIPCPLDTLKAIQDYQHPKIALPRNIYKNRLNSSGIDITNTNDMASIFKAIRNYEPLHGGVILGGKLYQELPKMVTSAFDYTLKIGSVSELDPSQIKHALDTAQSGYQIWSNKSVEERAVCLEKLAHLMEEAMPSLVALCVYEGGKTIEDAVSEVREAIDFCRYYALQGRKDFQNPMPMDAPTGEDNTLSLHPRGIFLCISPWNFPLAIFTGQIAAALMAGNSVIAKPAGQTTLIATKVIQLFLASGIPDTALTLLPGPGQLIGEKIISDPHIAGIAFTGSTETAWTIQQTLSQRRSAIIPFIAETGGQNAMIVDSTALHEQVVRDVVQSAFNSAGQRCSALRILLLQDDVADPILTMLKGAMAELNVGDPRELSTDIGPVIDGQAQAHLENHIHLMKKKSKLLYQTEISEDIKKQGNFVAPTAFEIDSLSILTEEVFGPILHVMRFKIEDLDDIIQQVNQLGFGLTFGIHSRLDKRTQEIAAKINVGNIYVNRNTVGAVVGAQPFGGQGLSGTGPKAGGPFYLHQFATEKTISIDTTAQGGNTSLLTL